MNKEEVQKLKHGLYKLYWKEGGTSLASVGSLHDGSRWFSCCNWTNSHTENIASTKWDAVEKAVWITTENQDEEKLPESSPEEGGEEEE